MSDTNLENNKKCLFIVSNVYTSNASSILIKSLLDYLPKYVNIYIISDSVRFLNNLSYNTFIMSSKLEDSNKTKLFFNEILSFEEIELNFNKNIYGLIFAWSNPFDTSNLACFLSKKYNVPCILRLGDIYMCKNLKKRFDKFLIASKIIVPNKIMKDKIIKHCGNEYIDKINVISQHYSLPKKYKIVTKSSNKITILHAGNMYEHRKIDFLINAINDIDNELKKNILIQFIGSHNKLKDDIELCRKNNINADFTKCYEFENWKFLKSIDFDVVRDHILNSDVLLHIEYITNENHFLSFKLVDYLSYSKPIITITQKNSPNHLLSQECNFGFADIENYKNITNVLSNVIKNPNLYMPNDNKQKYDVSLISKQWNIQISSNMNYKNYIWINILKNNYDNHKLQKWISDIDDKIVQNICHKDSRELYTIWILTVPFSESLIYTMKNLNYIGYYYKIILNDDECNALNYARQNTNTKYWIRCDDDILFMTNSIEYMINIKKNISEPVCIFRLYDLNVGYYKINNIYARYGIKIHDTEICKKIIFTNNVNSDIYYQKLKQYGGYINYEDWKNNGMIIGYHELFCSDRKIFNLFVKLGCKYRLYDQDVEIVFYFLNNFTNTRAFLEYFLIRLINMFNLNVEFEHIKKSFGYDKLKNIINFAPWIEYKHAWLFENLTSDNNLSFFNVYTKITKLEIIKLIGFIYGLKYDYNYKYENLMFFENLFLLFQKQLSDTKLFDNTTYQLIEFDNINELNNDTIIKYNHLKKNNVNVKISTKIMPCTEIINIDIHDLIVSK